MTMKLYPKVVGRKLFCTPTQSTKIHEDVVHIPKGKSTTLRSGRLVIEDVEFRWPGRLRSVLWTRLLRWRNDRRVKRINKEELGGDVPVKERSTGTTHFVLLMTMQLNSLIGARPKK